MKTNILFVVLIVLDSLEELRKTQVVPEQFFHL